MNLAQVNQRGTEKDSYLIIICRTGAHMNFTLGQTRAGTDVPLFQPI